MYTSTLIFAPGAFDDAFHRLEQRIAGRARAIPGYTRVESAPSDSS